MTSAFVIYIHPQLQRDPSEDSAGLLRVLLYRTDSTIFGDEVPGIPEWTGPQYTVVAALILLYLSLATSMTAVLYSILAKQLLTIYALAASKPKWFSKILHVAVLLLSLMLQLALFLLTCALTVYIWDINILVASLILFFTVGAIPIYCIFVVLALVNLEVLRFTFLDKIWDWVSSRFAGTPGGVRGAES